MLQIAIYSDRYDDAEKLKSTIQDFLIETRTMAKVSHLDDPEAFLVVPDSYDIYIMDMDSKVNIITLTNKMKTIDTGAHYIFISSNPETDAVLATKARCDYFLEKPLDEKEFLEVLKEIKKEIKEDNVIIKIAGGERRIRANHLNYINIEKRCLCYHLSDGTMFDG